jgi:hypothetical protein
LPKVALTFVPLDKMHARRGPFGSGTAGVRPSGFARMSTASAMANSVHHRPAASHEGSHVPPSVPPSGRGRWVWQDEEAGEIAKDIHAVGGVHGDNRTTVNVNCGGGRCGEDFGRDCGYRRNDCCHPSVVPGLPGLWPLPPRSYSALAWPSAGVVYSSPAACSTAPVLMPPMLSWAPAFTPCGGVPPSAGCF